MTRQLSLTELEEALFDPLKDPFLRPGFVTPRYFATPDELRAAAELLAYRRDHYGWRSSALPKSVVAAVATCLAQDPPGPRPMQPDAIPAEMSQDAQPARADDNDEEPLRRRLASGLAWRPLPFYRGGRLVHVPAEAPDLSPAGADRVLVFKEKSRLRAVRLDGESMPFHEANALVPFDPSPPGAVEEYVDVFCAHLRADDGGFYIIEEGDFESPDDDPAVAGPAEEILVPAGRELPQFYHVMRDFRRGDRVSPEERTRFGPVLEGGRLVRAQLAHPITRLGPRQEGEEPPERERPFVLLATLIYGGGPVRAVFSVEPTGAIDMLEDRDVRGAAVRPLTPVWLPRVRP